MTDLSRICEARAAIDAARAELRAAVAEAHAAGASAPAIALVLGVTRQRVYQLIRECEPAADPKAELVARLATLDKRWNGLVDKLAPAFVRPDQKQETGARNRVAKKRANKGLPPLRTVKAEARAFAEEHVLQYLENHPELPVCQVALREVLEADMIRAELAAMCDNAACF